MSLISDTAGRTDELVETEFRFGPGEPIRVRVVHRPHRTQVTDDGAAIAKAGRPPHWRQIARRLAAELNVNISRQGVVFLPVVRVGPDEPEVIRRIGAASLAFYEELLDSA